MATYVIFSLQQFYSMIKRLYVYIAKCVVYQFMIFHSKWKDSFTKDGLKCWNIEIIILFARLNKHAMQKMHK